MRYAWDRLCLIALALGAHAAPSCRAADAGAPRFETYAGVDYDGRAASLTSTMVWSYLGPLDKPGLRIKIDGLADIYGDTNASVFSSNFLAANLKGLGDVMTGVQFNLGSVWIKLYGGAAYEAQAKVIWQAGQLVQTQSWGAAAAAEVYWQSGRTWASAALSWLQPDSSGSYYSRAAYEIYRVGNWKISAGVEAGLGSAMRIFSGKAKRSANMTAMSAAAPCSICASA